MENYYISKFITKGDYTFSSSFFSNLPFEEEGKNFLYTSYEYTTNPIPGYELTFRRLKSEDEAEMSIEISYVAFIPMSSVDHLILKDKEELTKEQIELLNAKEIQKLYGNM